MTFTERQTLKILVSERVRELRPWTRECLECGGDFVPERPRSVQAYCSLTCRNTHATRAYRARRRAAA